MTYPRFVVGPEIVSGSEVRLPAEVVRHLRALRLRSGDRIVLTDGRRRQTLAAIENLDRSVATVHILAELPADNESKLELFLFVTPGKWERLEWALEKSTELGISDLTILQSDRAPELHGWTEARRQRLQRIAIAATEQSQRSVVPTISGPISLGDVLRAPPRDTVCLIADAESRYQGPTPDLPPSADRAAIVIGPPGGFTPDEISAATAAGWLPLSLGPRILRFETAVVVAACLAQSRWGDLHP